MKDNKKIALICLTTAGTVLVWRGIWELSEKYIEPEVSLITGIIILLCVGIISKKEFFKFI